MTLVAMLEESARKFGPKKALVFGKRKISFRQLDDYAKKLSEGLIRLGIKTNDKVGILLGNCPEFVISYFGILGSGGIVVSLNTLLKADELKYILNDCEAKAIITSREFLEVALQLRLRIESLKDIIVIDGSVAGTVSFAQLMEETTAEQIRRKIEPDEVAVILYTSGTTGYPKGAMLTHTNLLSNTTAGVEAIKITKRDNFLCVLPMFHSFTSTVCILMPLYAGATIVIIESLRHFTRVVSAIVKNRVTVFIGIPPLYNVLANSRVPRILVSRFLKLLNPLRLCISGAAPLPIEVLEKFERKFRIPLLEGYGLTETSPVVSINPLKGTRKPGSVGLPLPGVEVRVVDEKGRELSPGEVGELLVRGPNVMKGYYNLFKATEETIKERWLYTGDMAKIDDDGYIYIVDRKKDLIIVRGLNVYPREIEEVLYAYPPIAEAAVIGIKDEHKGEVPIAFVALKEGATAEESDIIHFCRKKLASYKVPRSIEFRKTLPKTPTGKILKRALRKE